VISYPFSLRDRVIIFENVPAFVCNQCGEILLAGETAKLIDDLARGDSPPTRTTEVPVYDLGR